MVCQMVVSFSLAEDIVLCAPCENVGHAGAAHIAFQRVCQLLQIALLKNIHILEYAHESAYACHCDLMAIRRIAPAVRTNARLMPCRRSDFLLCYIIRSSLGTDKPHPFYKNHYIILLELCTLPTGLLNTFYIRQWHWQATSRFTNASSRRATGAVTAPT